MVPAPRSYEQSIEVFEQILGSSAFLNQTGPLGPLNSTLNRILVEAPEHIV